MIVRGRVQGVFYRSFTCRVARELGLAGYVCNLEDGAVEVWAEGDREKLEQLIVYLKEGPSSARVDKVVTKWSEMRRNFSDFSIKIG